MTDRSRIEARRRRPARGARYLAAGMSAAATFNLMTWFSIRDRAAAQKGPEPAPANGETSTGAPSSTPAPQPTYVSLPRAVQSPAGMPAAIPAARPRTTTAGSGSVPMQSPAGSVVLRPAATHPAAAASISSPVGGSTPAPSMPASTVPATAPAPAPTMAPTKAPVPAPTAAPAPSLPLTPSPSPTPVTVTHHS